jgi:hypothetical protein
MTLNQEQVFFIVTLSCYVVSAALLWRAWVMKPFKLWTTFMHEFSHACGAWLTCHQVTGIEVHMDEGGLTHWRGNNVACAKHVVLPAGYLGSALWGSATLLSTTEDTWMSIMALVLTGALAASLVYALCGETKDPANRLPLIWISIGFGAVLGTLSVLTLLEVWYGSAEFLEAVMIWIGTLNMLYAIIDIYDDTVRRSDERSDAYQYAKIWPCCFPRCVGFTWLLMSVALAGATVFTCIYIVRGDSAPVNWTAYLPGPIVLGLSFGLQLCIPCLLNSGGVTENKPLLG